MSVSSSTSYADILQREQKSHGSLLFPAACYSVPLPEVTIPLHWHDEMESLFVEKGRLNIIAGTERLMLREGEGIFINSDVIHTVEACCGQGALIRSVVFHPRLVAGTEERLYWDKFLLPLINGGCPYQLLKEKDNWQRNILSRTRTAWERIASDSPGFELRVRSDISEIIAILAENRHRDELIADVNVLRNNDRLKKMLNHIHGRYFEQISLEDIAGSANVSKSSCLRIFREVLNTTPLHYVGQYRLMVAAQHLEESDRTISEIGYGCGFSEMGYFAARFREKFGVSPKEYRKKGCRTGDMF